jgi:galactose mutarotase-like enzyme
MWRPPGSIRLFRNWLWDAFEQSTLAGADECLPTIAPCVVSGRPLPDHGEAWSSPWRLDENSWRSGMIRTSLQLPVSPLEFERCITVNASTATFEYRIYNDSTEPVPFLWAFHPLLSIEPGDRLELPECVRNLKVCAQKGVPQLEDSACWNWPEPTPGIRLDHIDLGENSSTYAKVFADLTKCENAWAAVRRGRERIVFRFDESIPYLGIWLSRGGWNGYTHMAIEPATAATDALSDNQTFLPPRSAQRWRFGITIEELNGSNSIGGR